MKKFFALLLALTMALFLAACGGDDAAPEAPTDGTPDAPVEEAAIETVTPGKLTLANTPDADIVQLSKVTGVISEVLGGKLDAGYAEGMAIESYQANYPELYIAFDVPSAAPKGGSIGMNLDSDALLAGVNEALAAAKAEGLLDTFMAEAQALANGNIYEGLME